ncbi:uncharacterized protein LOC142814466 [Rhipicephalus microplus]|uniref:uncharacterized protein LOC142814466 n=1 Tax=Rhipicephalus microplus TaxID=6941 RepID=UPI003F6B7FDB
MPFSQNELSSRPEVCSATRGPVTRTQSETSSCWTPPWDLDTGLLPITAQEEVAAQRQPQRQSKLILVPAAVVVFLMVSAITASVMFGHEFGSNYATPLETSDGKVDDGDSGGPHGKTVGARLVTTGDDNADIDNISSVINASTVTADPEPWRGKSHVRGP